MGERHETVDATPRPSTLEDLRAEVLRKMQEARLQQEAAVRGFVSEAGKVMSGLHRGVARPEVDALSLLETARQRFAVTADRAADRTSGDPTDPSPREAVEQAAEEALEAVAATDRASGEG